MFKRHIVNKYCKAKFFVSPCGQQINNILLLLPKQRYNRRKRNYKNKNVCKILHVSQDVELHTVSNFKSIPTIIVEKNSRDIQTDWLLFYLLNEEL